ncbi:hypothetical protein G6F68_014366 [Rhizopus microsporus]|nr:hypothetical protein G6F68_014366 [Rhizopus microsporus]
MASAISSPVPTLPTGSCSAIDAKSGSLSAPATSFQIGVRTQPGDTALIRNGASSTAIARTTPSSAALISATATPLGLGR